MKKLTCADVRSIDLVDYLKSLGHLPTKIRNNDYWYLSPLRNEHTASFKVDRRKNLWFDFGTGEGGDIINFGVHYYLCSVSSLLQRLGEKNPDQLFLFHPRSENDFLKKENDQEKEKDLQQKILITETRTISSPSLREYLNSRCIQLDIARAFCREVDFDLYGKKQTAIGFKNDLGGMELRNSAFKGSNSPKTSRFIDNGSAEISVFEGFFDFLSFLTIRKATDATSTNYLILNSLAFFEKSRELMESHKTIKLFLDRDQSGIIQTMKTGEWDQSRYIDNSHFYRRHHDLNEWLVANKQKFDIKKEIVQKYIPKHIHKRNKT